MYQQRFSSVHSHCAKCYSWKCTETPDYVTSCELVECDQGCGCVFHACKYPQHKSVCQSALIPCINEVNGCDVQVTKSKMAAHLLVCPANVLQCKRSCSGIFRREEFLWHSRNAHIDIDSGITSSSCPLSNYQCDFSCVKLTMDDPMGFITKDALHKCHAVAIEGNDNKCMATEGQDIYLEDLPDNVLEQIVLDLDSLSIRSLSLTSKFFRSFCRSLLSKKGVVDLMWVKDCDNNKKWKIQKLKWYFSTATTPIRKWKYHLSTPISEHLKECNAYLGRPEDDKLVPCVNGCGLTLYKSQMTDHRIICQHEKIPCINHVICDAVVMRSKMAAHLRSCPANAVQCNSNITPKEMGKCFRVFRREEITGHQKLTHVELCDLSVTPCPLVSQGCGYTVTRITPENPNKKLVFTDTTKSFAVVQKNDEDCLLNSSEMSPEYSHAPDNNFCYLENLPQCVMHKILFHLDSLSLNHLSRTSSHLRSLCREVLPQKGVVEHVWEKVNGGWRASKKRWYFSTA